MLALWIILGILALLALLLVLPLRIYLKYDTDGGLRYRVKYLFLTLADSEAPEKPKQAEQPVKQTAEAEKKRSGGDGCGFGPACLQPGSTGTVHDKSGHDSGGKTASGRNGL